ncbi:CcdB family protein [Atlantibacter sp.]|uniref:CcdB family protein n=1 Tax=Atlantibacter sp. TaxID=1903473 RepID=UPI0028A90A49|nr:CcdB family protein [Atlantibacter sp.]
MQFTVYKNTGRMALYPYVLNVQSDIIGRRTTRVVIPLFPLEKYMGPLADRLTPIVTVGPEKFVLMTHELASIPEKALGEEICSIMSQRDVIKSALDFLLDGIG